MALWRRWLKEFLLPYVILWLVSKQSGMQAATQATHTHTLYLLFLVEKPRAKLCATLPQGTMSTTCSECLVWQRPFGGGRLVKSAGLILCRLQRRAVVASVKKPVDTFVSFSGISSRYSWNTRKLHCALKWFPKGCDCGYVIMVQLRKDRSFLSYTVLNICDVFGTGCTCICRGFNKRRNNWKKKKVRKGSNKQVVLSKGRSIFELYSI
jgi:hypothetical protein